MALVVYIKIQQQKYLGNYPDVDCSQYPDVTKQDVKSFILFRFSIYIYKVENEYLSTVKIGLVECYCKQDLTDRLYEEFNINGNNIELCYIWFKHSIFVNGLPIAIGVIIIMINVIIQKIFQGN